MRSWTASHRPPSDLLHACEAGADAPRVLDEALEHRDPVAAADHLRVHGDHEDAALDVLVHVVELALPDLEHLRRRRQADARRIEVELEVWPVVELEAHRDLGKGALSSAHDRL